MKIVAVVLARCMWVIDFDRVNPRGRSLLDALNAIAQRYRFAKFPAHLLDYGKSGALEFLSGTFVSDGTDLRVGMTIFNNGIQADTLSSTDDAEKFLEDLRAWLEKEWNLPIDDEAILQKSYQNQLDIQVNRNLVLVNPRMQQLADKLSSQCQPVDNKPRKFFISGLVMVPEDVGVTGSPMPFRFERKWGTPFEKNIYFAQAQLRTDEHIQLIEELEKLAAAD
jgi:hypothetical protein